MKRWIAMLLTVCMLISLCPVGAFAESAAGGTEPAQTVQTEQGATGATKGTAAPRPLSWFCIPLYHSFRKRKTLI